MADYRARPLCESDRDRIRAAMKFLPPDEVALACPYFELRTWKKDAVLMKDGEAGDFMGIILSGQVAVRKETSFPGKYTLVAVLDPGAMVGEISAVEKGLRSATVVAMGDVELLTLDSAGLERLLAERPPIGVKVLKRIVHVLSLRLRKAYDRLSSLL